MSGVSGMMGERYGGMVNFLWPTLLTASAAVMVVAITYIIAFPTIKYSTAVEQKQEIDIPSLTNVDPMDIVIRVAKPDERAALEVLKNSGGLCLQKDITYKTGLSKLKTHRIVARLAERGIIDVKKVGKTNEIRVPAWLKRTETMAKTATAESA